MIVVPLVQAQGEPTAETLAPPPIPDEPTMTGAATPAATSRVHLPMVMRAGTVTPAPASTWLDLVNDYRVKAGVSPVTEHATYNANCFEHARYMAENNHLTHNQNPELPWASPAGAMCAGKGNAWLGSSFSQPIWTVRDSIDGWMASPGHRLWLLYPTTPTFGYGFYTAANNRAGAALDVLSAANMGHDEAYTGWPIRYPAPNQTNIPAKVYPITLNWRYFGATPTVTSVNLQTASGVAIAHTITTALSAGHKGIQITPTQSLPPATTINVQVTGSYNGQAFSFSWQFTTGN
ncbi:MAG: CAP domain-containing protein [Oscillochloridaceae bacterium umkhey_bin13]